MKECLCAVHLKTEPELRKAGIEPLTCYCASETCPHLDKSGQEGENKEADV